MPNPYVLISKETKAFYKHDENTMGEFVSNALGILLYRLQSRYLNPTEAQQIAQEKGLPVTELTSRDAWLESQVDACFKALVLSDAKCKSLKTRLDETDDELDKITLSIPATSDTSVEKIKEETLVIRPKETLVLVYQAILDNDKWPLSEVKTPIEQQKERLDSLRNVLKRISKHTCNTGMRHDLASCLAGYEGIEIVEIESSFILKCTYEYIATELFANWQEPTVFSEQIWPWLKERAMPENVLMRFTEPVLTGLKNYIEEAIKRHGINPATRQKIINDFCNRESIQSLKCEFIEDKFIYLLQDWLRQYWQDGHDKRIVHVEPIQQKVDKVIAWLDKAFIVNNMSHQERFGIIYRLFSKFDQLAKAKLLLRTQVNSVLNTIVDSLQTYTELERFSQLIERGNENITTRLDEVEVQYNALHKEGFVTEIESFFALWIKDDARSNNRTRGNLLYLLSQPTFIKAILLSDEIIKQFSSRIGEKDFPSLTVYELNRCFLHGLIVPVNEWTDEFTMLFSQLLQFIKDYLIISSNHQLGGIQSNYYPTALIEQLTFLLAIKNQREQSIPQNVVFTPAIIKTTADIVLAISFILASGRSDLEKITCIRTCVKENIQAAELGKILDNFPNPQQSMIILTALKDKVTKISDLEFYRIINNFSDPAQRMEAFVALKDKVTKISGGQFLCLFTIFPEPVQRIEVFTAFKDKVTTIDASQLSYILSVFSDPVQRIEVFIALKDKVVPMRGIWLDLILVVFPNQTQRVEVFNALKDKVDKLGGTELYSILTRFSDEVQHVEVFDALKDKVDKVVGSELNSILGIFSNQEQLIMIIEAFKSKLEKISNAELKSILDHFPNASMKIKAITILKDSAVFEQKEISKMMQELDQEWDDQLKKVDALLLSGQVEQLKKQSQKPLEKKLIVLLTTYAYPPLFKPSHYHQSEALELIKYLETATDLTPAKCLDYLAENKKKFKMESYGTFASVLLQMEEIIMTHIKNEQYDTGKRTISRNNSL